jgi:hypothetical protein
VLDAYRECHIRAVERVQNKLLNLPIIQEAQSGNPWFSVQGQQGCVRTTKRITAKERGKIQGTGFMRHTTGVELITVGK